MFVSSLHQCSSGATKWVGALTRHKSIYIVGVPFRGRTLHVLPIYIYMYMYVHKHTRTHAYMYAYTYAYFSIYVHLDILYVNYESVYTHMFNI